MKPATILTGDKLRLLYILLCAIPLAICLSQIFPRETTRIVTVPESTRSASRCCGPGCRDRTPHTEAHYDAKYFAWQTRLGREKAASRDWNALLETSSSDVVADLGAGGGHILAVLNVSRRIAVEINAQARAAMTEMYGEDKIETVEFPEDLKDESVDILFSTSAIEHFECPLTEVREMGRKVKVGGRVVIGVKNEGAQVAVQVKDDDINQHVYTWNRQLLYNMVKKAGFEVDKIQPSDADLIAKGMSWNTEEHLKSFNTFIYHWIHGTKRRAAPKDQS